jgi:hypothetical protein
MGNVNWRGRKLPLGKKWNYRERERGGGKLKEKKKGGGV